MRKLVVYLIVILFLATGMTIIQANEPEMEQEIEFTQEEIIESNPTATSFIPNQGQLDHTDIQFYTQGHFRTGFCSDSVVYILENNDLFSFNVHFEGCNPTNPIGKKEQITKHNYFLGNDPDKWQSNVPLFGEVVYPEIYPGIDLRYYSKDGNLKYDFIVQPGADPNIIRMRYVGVDGLSLDQNNDLLIKTPFGVIKDQKLIGYQDSREVPVQFCIQVDIVSFSIYEYDNTEPLIIDPEIVYSTYLGGSDGDNLKGQVVDDKRNIIICGYSNSLDFPTTPGAYNTTGDPKNNAIVSKISSSGELVFSTYIGGNEGDTAEDIAMDENGDYYIVGGTTSPDFPITAGAFQSTLKLNDLFVLKLSNNGSELDYSTYVGGNHVELCNDIKVHNGYAILAGKTSSPDFPTTSGAYLETYSGSGNSFVLKLSQSGGSLVYCSFLGLYNDLIHNLKLDSLGRPCVVGRTDRATFPTTANAFDVVFNGSNDGYLTIFEADGSDLNYSTFIGGSRYDECLDIAFDDVGNIYLTGQTSSSDYYNTSSANDTSLAENGDCYVTKIDKDGRTLVFSTYFGGNYGDGGCGIDVNALNEIVIGGYSRSTDLYITDHRYENTTFGYSSFVNVYSPDGSQINYSLIMGSIGLPENLKNIEFDLNGNIIFSLLYCNPDLYTTENAIDSTGAGGTDFYISKIRLNPEPPTSRPIITTVDTGDSFANLTWEPPFDNGGSPLTHYSIYRSTSSGDKTKLTDTVDNTSWFEDTGLTNGVTYYYNISAVNAIGEGPLSTEVNGTPLKIPSEPLNLQKETGPEFINISWDVPSDDGGTPITGYNIYRGTTSESLSLTMNNVQEFWYNDTGRTNGVTYFYAVAAVNSVGIGLYSIEINDTPYDKPTAPYFLTAETFDGALNLSWNAPVSDGGDPNLSYDVFRGESNLTMVEVVSDLDILFFNNTGLTNGKTYFFTVRAKNFLGNSPFSDEFNSTPASVPSAPLDLIAIPGNGYVQLNWTVPLSDGGDPISNYKVYRGLSSGSKIFHTQTSDLGFTDLVVDNDKTYYYEVQAINLLGPSDFSNEAIVAIALGPILYTLDGS